MKEDERLKIASGTVLSNDRVRSKLLGKRQGAVPDLKITKYSHRMAKTFMASHWGS